MAVFTRLIDGFWSARIVTESALDVMVVGAELRRAGRRVGDRPDIQVVLRDGVACPVQVIVAPGATVEPVQAASAALSSVISNGPPRVTLPGVGQRVGVVQDLADGVVRAVAGALVECQGLDLRDRRRCRVSVPTASSAGSAESPCGVSPRTSTLLSTCPVSMSPCVIA